MVMVFCTRGRRKRGRKKAQDEIHLDDSVKQIIRHGTFVPGNAMMCFTMIYMLLQLQSTRSTRFKFICSRFPSRWTHFFG